jgi:hypothetical protein
MLCTGTIRTANAQSNNLGTSVKVKFTYSNGPLPGKCVTYWSVLITMQP